MLKIKRVIRSLILAGVCPLKHPALMVQPLAFVEIFLPLGRVGRVSRIGRVARVACVARVLRVARVARIARVVCVARVARVARVVRICSILHDRGVKQRGVWGGVIPECRLHLGNALWLVC